MFSCECREIFKSTYFEEHLAMTVSGPMKYHSLFTRLSVFQFVFCLVFFFLSFSFCFVLGFFCMAERDFWNLSSSFWVKWARNEIFQVSWKIYVLSNKEKFFFFGGGDLAMRVFAKRDPSFRENQCIEFFLFFALCKDTTQTFNWRYETTRFF